MKKAILQLFDNVAYFTTGAVGIVLGLTPLVVLAVAIALLIERNNWKISSPLDSEHAQDLASGMLSLLVAFLVSKNIDSSMSVNEGVDSVRTTAVELASLAHSVRTDACSHEIEEIIDASKIFLNCVLTEKTDEGLTVDDGLRKALRAVHAMKLNKQVEPAIVPVFVRAVSACYAAHSALWSRRELSGTPSSIKLTVYVTAVLNAAFVISDLDVSEATRVAASIFVIVASIGAYSISSVIRDPLYWRITRGTTKKMIAESTQVVESLHATRCFPALEFSLRKSASLLNR